MIPEKYLDLFGNDKKAYASLATVMPDGSPQVTLVWFEHDHGKILVNSAKGRVKTRNMSVGSKVALLVVDPENPYRTVQVRGTVTHSTEEGGDAHADKLTKKYLGLDSYPYRQPGEVRVIFTIEPTSVAVMG